jgi:hypothetical protein
VFPREVPNRQPYSFGSYRRPCPYLYKGTVGAAYRLDRPAIATLMRVKPELSQGLETQARRGTAWIRCESQTSAEKTDDHPELLLVRLQQFLHRLSISN